MAKMASLSVDATLRFERLVNMALDAAESRDDRHPHVKIDNSNGRFIPLTVEYIGTAPGGDGMWSVAHWLVMNGDAMRDPEVVFWRAIPGVRVVPVSFRNDYTGAFDEVVEFDEDGVWAFKPRSLSDLCSFSGAFLRNVFDQQGIAWKRRAS
jgi:hypothetical protein